MAGPTTTGLAALIDGEDWHYVGETDEPAFENSWENVGSVGIGGPASASGESEAGGSGEHDMAHGKSLLLVGREASSRTARGKHRCTRHPRSPYVRA